MPSESFINHLGLLIMVAATAGLGWLLVTGRLRERTMALGPSRDLTPSRGVYLGGAIGVLVYIVLKLVTGGLGQPVVSSAVELLPFALTGLLISQAMYNDAGFRKIGLAPRHPWRDLGWTLIAIPMALGLAGVAGLMANTLSTWLNQPVQEVAHETLRMLREDPNAQMIVTVIISAVILAPLLEEIVFRGVLQTSLMRLLGGTRWPALLLTGLLFSVTHWWAVPWQGLLPLFVLGLVFGYLYERTGSLLTPILTHAGFNAANIAMALAMPMEAAQ